MEAASKLKGANLDSTTFSTEGNYSGGFKNGKKHGFGYVVVKDYTPRGPAWRTEPKLRRESAKRAGATLFRLQLCAVWPASERNKSRGRG